MIPHLYIAIPAINELDFLPTTLAAIAKQQVNASYTVVVCVNQPDDWWQREDKRDICLNNQALISYLRDASANSLKTVFSDFIPNIKSKEKKGLLIDCSSPGKGWKGKRHGVGWARKTIFDSILQQAHDEDILISLDADTVFNEHYFQSIIDNFSTNPECRVISVPYYHPLSGNDIVDRSMLRYELYLRNWFLNMHRIKSPYAFTAVGSAIAMKAGTLKKIGGITPVLSGEDFYLMQKLRKATSVNNWNSESVFPAGRFSDRVYFGTGPAMIKGAKGDWESYPIYHYSLFDKIAETYQIIDQLFTENVNTTLNSFLQQQFKDPDLWQPLRKNSKTRSRFERAFHEKADGLRLFQFIRQEHEKQPYSDEQGLYYNLQFFFDGELPIELSQNFSFDALTTQELNQIRDLLWEKEMELRKKKEEV